MADRSVEGGEPGGTASSRYRPLEPRVFNGGAASTWINLGLWPAARGDGGAEAEGEDRAGRAQPQLGEDGATAYAAACRSLALSVARAGRLGPGHRVLDVGCGCGDSLALWLELGVAEAVGVNVTASECALARLRLEAAGVEPARGSVVCADGIAFVERGGARFDRVVSVDALYHLDTRRRFLTSLLGASPGAGRFAAADTFGSADLVPLDTLRTGSCGSGWALLLRAALYHPLRTLAVAVVAAASGIPFENLCYRAESLPHVIARAPGQPPPRLDHLELVTRRVFAPFASHAIKQGRIALAAGEWATASQLVAAAAFMRAMAICGVVEVAVYAFDFPEC
jgi:SAM-dependent methyltransferase